MRTSYRGCELIKEVDYQLDALIYNRVRLYLKHHKTPKVIKLPRVVYIQLEFEEDTWWCLDSSLNNRPLFAWTHFSGGSRKALDEPVDCQLRIFSARAEYVLFEVVRELAQDIGFRLKREQIERPKEGRVMAFPVRTARTEE